MIVLILLGLALLCFIAALAKAPVNVSLETLGFIFVTLSLIVERLL